MKLSETDIDNLLADLSGKDAEKREKAERFYTENKADIVPQLREVFNRKIASHRRALRISRVLGYFLPFLVLADIFNTLLTLFVAIFSAPGYEPILFEFVITEVFLLALTFLCSAHILYWRIRPDATQVVLLQQFGEINDPRLAGYLIDLMEEGNPHWRDSVELLFYQQITTLRPMQLSTVHRSYLRKRVIYYAAFEKETFDEAKSLALLKALEQVGQEDCDTVRRIQMEGRSQAVRVAARECLQHLKLPRRENTAYSTLLRASENANGQEELLRAANFNAEIQAETLLRVPKE